MPSNGLGWQPSRFLADRAEAERAFALAERLGSVNAAAQELGTTWPSLRKAFARHGLGMPARNPEAVRQRAIEAARKHSGRQASPSLDPVFVTLNHGKLPIRARSGGELAERVRRAEDYATLGARVVVELHSESHAAKPSTRAWAITRRADRGHRLAGQRTSRAERRQADRADRTTRSHQLEERGRMIADAYLQPSAWRDASWTRASWGCFHPLLLFDRGGAPRLQISEQEGHRCMEEATRERFAGLSYAVSDAPKEHLMPDSSGLTVRRFRNDRRPDGWCPAHVATQMSVARLVCVAICGPDRCPDA